MKWMNYPEKKFPMYVYTIYTYELPNGFSQHHVAVTGTKVVLERPLFPSLSTPLVDLQ